MKLKGAAKNMNPKTPVLLAVLLGAALTLLRVFQSLKLIDPSTGFFTDKSNVTVPLFFVLAVGTPLALLLVSYLCPLSKAEGIPAGKNPLHALSALLLAGAVAYDAAGMLTSAEKSRLTMFSAALGLLAAVSLVIVAIAFFTGSALAKKAKILHLVLPLWALTKTVSYFTINVPYLRNSALLLCIFGDLMLMIFFFEYARKISFLAGDGNSPSFLTAGLTAAVFQLAAGVTGVIGRLPGHTPILHADFAFYRLFAALFCITAVAVFFKNKAPDYAPQEAEIETHPLPAGAEGPVAEASPATEAPAEETAVEEAPVEETPVEDPSVEEVPVEEALPENAPDEA